MAGICSFYCNGKHRSWVMEHSGWTVAPSQDTNVQMYTQSRVSRLWDGRSFQSL